MSKLAVIIVPLFILFTPTMSFAEECDDKCRSAVADKVDSEVTQLDPSDRQVIVSIKAALDTGSNKVLYKLLKKMDNPRSRVKDAEQRRFWSEVIYIAINYAERTDCAERGFWFWLYVSAWKTRDEECLKKADEKYGRTPNDAAIRLHQYARAQCEKPDPSREELFKRAQDYLFARHNGNGAYNCTPHKE